MAVSCSFSVLEHGGRVFAVFGPALKASITRALEPP